MPFGNSNVISAKLSFSPIMGSARRSPRNASTRPPRDARCTPGLGCGPGPKAYNRPVRYNGSARLSTWHSNVACSVGPVLSPTKPNSIAFRVTKSGYLYTPGCTKPLFVQCEKCTKRHFVRCRKGTNPRFVQCGICTKRMFVAKWWALWSGCGMRWRSGAEGSMPEVRRGRGFPHLPAFVPVAK
jgi:hypothetical protein